LFVRQSLSVPTEVITLVTRVTKYTALFVVTYSGNIVEESSLIRRHDGLSITDEQDDSFLRERRNPRARSSRQASRLAMFRGGSNTAAAVERCSGPTWPEEAIRAASASPLRSGGKYDGDQQERLNDDALTGYAVKKSLTTAVPLRVRTESMRPTGYFLKEKASGTHSQCQHVKQNRSELLLSEY
jgi:hypothetical protein